MVSKQEEKQMPRFRCKYAAMCKSYQRTELPCICEDVAEVFCNVYRMFQKIEAKSLDNVLTA